MKTKLFVVLFVLTLVLLNASVQKSIFRGPYLGQEKPGTTLEIFAKGELNKYAMVHGKISFTPDGKEIYWENNAAPVQSRWKMRRDKSDKWLSGQKSFLDIKYNEGGLFFSYDGKRVYYHSRRPITGIKRGDKNIWFRERSHEYL